MLKGKNDDKEDTWFAVRSPFKDEWAKRTANSQLKLCDILSYFDSENEYSLQIEREYYDRFNSELSSWVGEMY